MLYKLISVNNEASAGFHYKGRTGFLEIIRGRFYFNDLRSSPILSEEKEGDTYTIVTQNTTYVFEKTSIIRNNNGA